MCAKSHQITREEQDEYAVLSYRRSQSAGERGIFKGEIVPVTIQPKKGMYELSYLFPSPPLCR